MDEENTMKAIVRDKYGSPDVLELKEIDKPVPGDDEVLVRVQAASVNTADLDHLRGVPYVARLGTGLREPRNRGVGLDVAGRVEAIGENVTRLQLGDEVWADLFGFGHGAFAEYVCAPQRAFALMPAGVTFEEAATVPHSAVLALQGLRGKGQIQPGQRVLINGAGGCVGPFAVQIAKAFGAEVTGVDHTGKLDMLNSIGADHVIDYTREDFTKNGQRYDLILDIAAQRSILHYRRSLGPRGSYVLVARSLAGFFQAMLVGVWISMTGSKKMGIFMWNPNKREDLEYLKGLLEAGRIMPLIDRRYELSEVPEALRYVGEGHARGKVVIIV
jgi:NADPH:quinone reductase-like Zn-dependent oxidoreductase